MAWRIPIWRKRKQSQPVRTEEDWRDHLSDTQKRARAAFVRADNVGFLSQLVSKHQTGHYIPVADTQNSSV